MAFPSRLVQPYQTGSQITAHAVPFHASTAAGNRVTIVFRAGSTATATAPEGWNSVASRSSTGDSYIWTKIVTSGEVATGSVTITTSTTIRAAGHAITTPGNTRIVGAFAASNVNDPPSLTHGWGSVDTLFMAVLTNRRSDSTVTAAPSNYGSLDTISQASSNQTSRSRSSVAFRELQAASDDPGAFTTSGTIDTPHSATIAISFEEVVGGTVAASLQPVTSSLAGTYAAPLSPIGGGLWSLEGDTIQQVAGELAATLLPITSTLSGSYTPPQSVTGALDAVLVALVSTLAGSYTTPQAVAGELDATLPAVTSALTGSYTGPSGADIGGGLWSLEGDLTQEVTGALDASLLPVTSSLTGAYTAPDGQQVAGELAASLPAVTASLAGSYYGPSGAIEVGGGLWELVAELLDGDEATGTLDATLQALTSSLSGTYSPPSDITGTLAATLLPITSSLAGAYTAPVPPVTGTLAATLPALTSSLAGIYIEPAEAPLVLGSTEIPVAPGGWRVTRQRLDRPSRNAARAMLSASRPAPRIYTVRTPDMERSRAMEILGALGVGRQIMVGSLLQVPVVVHVRDVRVVGDVTIQYASLALTLEESDP